MSELRNIYNTQTIRIMNGLYSNRFDDPLELRAMLERCELFSFAQELWQATLTRYPCELYISVLECCEQGGDMRAAAELFPRNKRAQWLGYCKTHKPDASTKPVEYVSAFFRDTCRANPLCRPCRCKKHLTDFFEQISGESHDSVKKNINNWLSGASTPNTREGYIRLCYALGLRVFRDRSIKTLDANRFLSFSCGQNPLYLRDKQEAIHYFCLMRPFGKELPADEEYDTVGNYKYACSLFDRLSQLQAQPVRKNDEYTMRSRLILDGITDENELLSVVARRAESDSERYYSAQKMLENFVDEYEIYQFVPEEDDGSKKKKKKTPDPAPGLTKGEALHIVDILSKAQTDTASIKRLGKFIAAGYTLSDALYKSDIVREMSNGLKTVSRGILLLAALSMNYGMAYDRSLGDMSEREFEDCKSFGAFCTMLSEVLESCNMAMLYPRRKLDFLVLHSYMLMTRDMNKKGTVGALSDYLMKTMQLIGKSMA